LFGENSAFTATMETQTKAAGSEQPITISGKMAFDTGKFRMEMDLSPMSAQMPAESRQQMKAMGMDLDHMVMISRPDKQTSYQVFPGMRAYIEQSAQDAEAADPNADFKLELTEIGKETVDGHPCVKNKAVVTDSKGKKTEFTLWNATDLKNFPVKLETNERGNAIVVRYKDVKLTKPAASLFDPPAGFQRHDNMPAMMQDVMMKRRGGGTP
jgi:hypothetical protein